jgi:hypothetical protein
VSLPAKEKTWLYVRLFALVATVFLAVYGGGQWFQAGKPAHAMYFGWERSIPLIPGMIYVYFSLNLLFWLPLFVAPLERLKPFASDMILVTLVAGVFFIFYPAELGYSRPAAIPGYEHIFERLWAIDGPKNLFPSLHIAYSTLCVLYTLESSRGMIPRVLMFAWLALIYGSVLLVHQHHVADIAGGSALALGAYLYSPMRSPQAAQHPQIAG